MRVHVLHHACCFDGAASAAIFTAFYQRHVDAGAEFIYIPKQHRQGDPFVDNDFDADAIACLDFRYTTDHRLTWFFDHHHSAFQLPGQREHFEADNSGTKFYDPRAPCCAGFIARIGRARFGFDASAYAELLRWAEIVDTAGFPNARVPVMLEDPALRVMTFAEHNGDVELIGRFVDDLIRRPLAQIANESYVKGVLDPVLARHAEDIKLLKARCREKSGVVEYDLLDQPPRAYNKFIPYFHHPNARYLVGVLVGPDGQARITAGYNPWLPPQNREYNIADLCEMFGGGGHPFVGGISFPIEQADRARTAAAYITAVLRGQEPPNP